MMISARWCDGTMPGWHRGSYGIAIRLLLGIHSGLAIELIRMVQEGLITAG